MHVRAECEFVEMTTTAITIIIVVYIHIGSKWVCGRGGYSWRVSQEGTSRRRRRCEGYGGGRVKIAANRDNNRRCWSLTFIFYIQ